MTADGGSSSLLDEQALDYLRRRGEEVEFAEGDVILRQGETDAAFWVILRGEIKIVLRSADGGDLSLVRLGPGETFGEMAILRSAPFGADAVAVTPVILLRYPGEFLPTALAECESLRRSLLVRMAHDLHRRSTQAVGLYKQTRALVDLHQGSLPDGAMIANSARMRAVVDRIERAGSTSEPVLITGEVGTGKLLVARMIHARSARADAPLIAVDCRDLPARDANTLLFGTVAASNADLSAERFGALHLAHRGSLVLRGTESLNEETQRELARHVQADREVDQRPFPDVRFILSTDTDAGGREPTRLVRELEEQLRFVIEMPTLAERPRDIVPLARTFLEEFDDSDRLMLTPSAERALVSLKYRHRNVDELRSVVELAARVADGDRIRAEHIFGGFDGERPIGLDFGRFWLVRWLVDGGGLGISRLAVAVGFVAVAAVCLVATGSAAARTANGAVWMLWEPVVFGLFLLVGSLWCTVCPLSSGGRAVQRVFSLGRPPPPWILRVGTWLSAAGLVLILWSEEFFDMAVTPFATGIMLLALMASAVVCCVIWQREVWCRHLRPLGRLGLALSPVAPLTVAARRSICASTCTTHDIPFFESLVVVSQPGTWWARWPGPAVTTMSLLRVAWVVFAAVLSATILWNANGVARKSGVKIRTVGWTVVIVACTVYTFGALLLVAG